MVTNDRFWRKRTLSQRSLNDRFWGKRTFATCLPPCSARTTEKLVFLREQRGRQ